MILSEIKLYIDHSFPPKLLFSVIIIIERNLRIKIFVVELQNSLSPRGYFACRRLAIDSIYSSDQFIIHFVQVTRLPPLISMRLPNDQRNDVA